MFKKSKKEEEKKEVEISEERMQLNAKMVASANSITKILEATRSGAYEENAKKSLAENKENTKYSTSGPANAKLQQRMGQTASTVSAADKLARIVEDSKNGVYEESAKKSLAENKANEKKASAASEPIDEQTLQRMEQAAKAHSAPDKLAKILEDSKSGAFEESAKKTQAQNEAKAKKAGAGPIDKKAEQRMKKTADLMSAAGKLTKIIEDSQSGAYEESAKQKAAAQEKKIVAKSTTTKTATPKSTSSATAAKKPTTTTPKSASPTAATTKTSAPKNSSQPSQKKPAPKAK